MFRPTESVLTAYRWRPDSVARSMPSRQKKWRNSGGVPRDKRQQAMANGLDCRRCLLGQCLDSGRAPAATPQRKYRSTRHHPGVGVHDAEDRPQQQLEGNSALSGNFLQRRQIGRQRRKIRRQRRDCRYHHQARRIRVSASNALHTDRCSRSCIPESSCLAARWFTETAANAAATERSLAECTASDGRNYRPETRSEGVPGFGVRTHRPSAVVA